MFARFAFRTYISIYCMRVRLSYHSVWINCISLLDWLIKICINSFNCLFIDLGRKRELAQKGQWDMWYVDFMRCIASLIVHDSVAEGSSWAEKLAQPCRTAGPPFGKMHLRIHTLHMKYVYIHRICDTVDGSEILHHLECINPFKSWDKLPTSSGFLGGFLVAINSHKWWYLGVVSFGFPPVSGGWVANEMSRNINGCCGFPLCAEQKGCKWKGHGSAVFFPFESCRLTSSDDSTETNISRLSQDVLSPQQWCFILSQLWKGTGLVWDPWCHKVGHFWLLATVFSILEG